MTVIEPIRLRRGGQRPAPVARAFAGLRHSLARVALVLVVLVVLAAAATTTTSVALAAPSSASAAQAPDPGCDPIDPAACLLPYPNDWFTIPDPRSATGVRLSIRPAATPANADGRHIAVAELNRLDGFSPGSMIVTHVGGLDRAGFERTGFPTFARPERYAARRAPVVVIDARTGKRHPVAAELDEQAATPAEADLLIRPLRNFREGRRYVVALRSLRRGDGSLIAAPSAFRRIRDRRPRGALERRRAARLASAFQALAKARISRKSLYLAWDFTVAGRAALSGRMLAIRDSAFDELGDRNLRDGKVRGSSPAFQITEVTDLDEEQSPEIMRRVRGELTVPCFLDQAGCPPGSRFALDRRGMPKRIAGNTMRAPFVCQIPRAAATAPAQPVLYGHGLLGDREELVRSASYAQAAQEHGIVFCATDWKGMSSEDLPTIAGRVLPDLGRFPLLADRAQQGMLAFLLLGRAMIHPHGLRADPAFQVAGHSALARGPLGFNGNSQGGIMGGALTAVAPDFEHSALGVPGMSFSTLLDRSTQFTAFASILYRHYARGVERPLGLALIQQLWDRAEADGYAQHMTRSPLPDTPRHAVLLLMAFGDHQVANVATAVEARTIGARLRTPALDAGRSPLDLFWGIAAIAPGRSHRGSALLAMDSGPLRLLPGGEPAGTPPAPLGNTPPAQGVDPHALGGTSPEIRRLVARFLRDGVLASGCDGRPCYIAGWAGP